MSVIVITHIAAPISDFEHTYAENEQMFKDISGVGRASGAIHHCFAEAIDGTVLVIDEWPSEEAFHAFFDAQADIGKLMAEAGVTAAPTSTSHRIIETSDRF